MDQPELQQKLSQPFNPDQWKEVVEHVFPGSQFYANPRNVPSNEEMVEQIADKGTVRLADGKNIALVELQLKPGSVHLHSNRVKLRSLVAKLIDQERAHGVVAVFEQGGGDYRLSFVAKEAVIEDGEFKVRETPAKRFTYLLGPGETCRTAAERLYSLSQKQQLTLNDITDAFSVEKLNKEFYRHIQKYFYELVGGKTDRAQFDGCMTLPNKPIEEQANHKAYSEFAVRLLGRIVFCWFLKHKRCDQDRPLIPEELLSSKAVENHENYYHAILEKLFFQTLNKPMHERSKYAPEFAHLIPYLNGGLFEPHHDDFYEEGAMGESKYIGTLKLPDDWFLRLFQTLEMFNFTIDENTALDADVSIDPEILGRIFENLLAEVNPETGDSARKSTGSFYTPREIVDYMVEESLLQHLKTSLGLTTKNTEHTGREKTQKENSVPSVVEKNLRALFVDDDQPHNLDDKTRRAVVDAFRTIKVLDPACGSGAFPVGILQKMLCALRKVDPENDLWLQAQIDQIQTMKLSRQEEDRRLDEIDHAFKTNEADYGRKLGIIQNSVYGVDIQPIAIEISKLRFFLTLVVDEKIDENEDNRGILPLPNLDFKFVCANTLIPAPEIPDIEKKQELGLKYEDTFFDEFTALTEQYFYAGTPDEKHRIREQLEAVVSAKVKSELDEGFKLSKGLWDDSFADADKLSKTLRARHKKEQDKLARNASLWESYKNIFTGQPVGFFDPKYMFPDAANRFDVVIANPPYVRQEDIIEFKPAFKAEFECYTGRADLLVYFYEKGCRLLKENGVLTYITSNKYFRAGYGDKLRGYLADTMRIHQLIDFGDAPVFDATAYPSIIVMSKGRDGCPQPSAGGSRSVATGSDGAEPSNEFLALNWTPGDPVSAFVRIFKERAFAMKQSYLTSDGWKIEDPQVFELILKLKSYGVSLGEYINKQIFAGIKSGLNDAFVIEESVRAVLASQNSESNKTIKPYLRGKHIKRWVASCSSQYIIYIPRGKEGLVTPAIREHLSCYKAKLEKRALDQKWFELQQAQQAYAGSFEGIKISFPDIAEKVTFAFDESGAYLDMTAFCIPSDSKYLLAVLNSRCVNYFFSNLGAQVRGGYLRFKRQYVSQIPIPAATSEQQAEIEERVERILALKKENPEADVSALETEIDQLVYKLYDLTTEEIEIIEGQA